jgi:hypothetical protein
MSMGASQLNESMSNRNGIIEYVIHDSHRPAARSALRWVDLRNVAVIEAITVGQSSK